MLRLLYSLSVSLYYLAIRIASPFNVKARLWVNGRKNLINELRSKISGTDKIIWFHAASLGEFEQGRPVMEAVRKNYPDHKILLTFFSPSGYTVRKHYDGADIVCYLPTDSLRNAKRFINTVNPVLVVFIKYEFWFNYLLYLRKRSIPVVFISVIFRPGQHFFKWYGTWFRKQIRQVRWFFVQNEPSLKLLNNIGITQCSVCGDTRFDRVFEASLGKMEFPDVAAFAAGNRVVLAGSTWPQDEELLVSAINKREAGIKYIIAPHEIHPARIRQFSEQLHAGVICFTSAKPDEYPQADVLIIDTIGILLHLYQYATVAYIGGGFGKSIHNILEAATFGKPVIFGPNYHKFQEAKDLLAFSGAFSVANKGELSGTIDMLMSMEAFYNNSATVCADYVKKRTGATRLIMNKFHEMLNV